MNKKDEQALKGGLAALFGGASAETNQADGQVTEIDNNDVEATQKDEADIIQTIENDRLRDALEAKRNIKRGRPRKDVPVISKANGYGRVCNVVNLEKMDKLREIAFRETLTIKQVVEAAFDLAIEKYEKKHGEIVPRPDVWKKDASTLFK